jgi:hypothetical protein
MTSKQTQQFLLLTYIEPGETSLNENIKQLQQRRLVTKELLRLKQIDTLIRKGKCRRLFRRAIAIASQRLKRSGRFRNIVRRVIGGLPEKAYALTLEIEYTMDLDKFATHTGQTTYQYKSTTSTLKQRTIDEAVTEFIQTTNLNALKPNSFHAGEAHVFNSRVVSHREYDEVKLSDLPLYGYHTLASKCCPDDELINITEGQCVIDGLLSVLRSHYTTKTRQQLIAELGTPTPSVNDIKAWILDDQYSYHDYVSIYILDPFNKSMFHHIGENTTRVSITAKVTNQHFYVITLKAVQRQIFQHHCIDFTQLITRNDMTGANSEYRATEFDKSDQPFILCETSDLSVEAKRIQTDTKTMIAEISFHSTRVTSFEHPVTNQLFLTAPNYTERREAADILLGRGETSFEFVNQTYCQIGQAHFRHRVGELPTETYGPDQLDILKHYPVVPYICRTHQEEQVTEDNMISIDMKNAYPSQFINNTTYQYPIFSFGDKKEAYVEEATLTVGEYYINKQVVMANGNQIHRKGWYSHNFVDYCLKRQYISHADILYQMKPHQYLEATTFRAWAIEVLRKLPKKGKHVLNHFIGHLGQQVYKKTQGAITNSFETAVGTVLENTTDGSRTRYYEIGDTYFLRRETEQRKYSGNAFIHRQELAGTFIEPIRAQSPGLEHRCYEDCHDVRSASWREGEE